tara:strand:- start:142 stop:429 length:288 start_codon:yes stop_codon:yes gene_type:complete
MGDATARLWTTGWENFCNSELLDEAEDELLSTELEYYYCKATKPDLVHWHKRKCSMGRLAYMDTAKNSTIARRRANMLIPRAHKAAVTSPTVAEV